MVYYVAISGAGTGIVTPGCDARDNDGCKGDGGGAEMTIRKTPFLLNTF